MGTTIQGITRPYVGQKALNIDDVKQVSDKKPGDVTSPATPVLLRAWAFELAADGSTLAPPPPPPGQPGRDPLVIELGKIEIGTRIELISLSDNPAAEFSATCKDEIFELPLTGYDVGNRQATIALNEKQMKEKGIAPGERFMLRQVDKDGNASTPIHVHLDPSGWANQTINEPVQGGGSQRVRGGSIDIAVGLHNLQGNPNPGQMERILGKATRDTVAPKMIDANVSVTNEKMTTKEHEVLKGYVAAMATLVGGVNYDAATIKQTLANNPSFEQHPSYKPHYALLKTLVADTAMFDRLRGFAAMINGQSANANNFIEWNAANQLAQMPDAPALTTVKLENAVEPGVTVTVQNSRTGESVSATQADDARSMQLLLKDVKTGDPLVVTFVDSNGNAGAPSGFRYDDKAKGGKAKSNPLDIRLSAFSLRDKPVAPTGG
jgi:hypothetical protein